MRLTDEPTYAPNYDVPENVSPFVPLPLLVRCSRCRAPQDELELQNVAARGRLTRNLCKSCASALIDGAA